MGARGGRRFRRVEPEFFGNGEGSESIAASTRELPWQSLKLRACGEAAERLQGVPLVKWPEPVWFLRVAIRKRAI